MVVIPRIQRDYAQGRLVRKEGNESSLNDQGRRFIDTIFSHLKEGLPMDMDFIYGSIEDGKFIPLDGQQRLTTLYLLYWYIGNKELEDKTPLFDLLKGFSYETRATARQFCEELSQEIELDFNGDPISKQLRDFPWYSKVYERDPTVIAMMNMLDAIHERYSELKHSCYKHLEQLTFSLLPLNRFHLTDELYIKMNARGKQLSDFENFKADFTKWMTTCEDFSQTQSYRKREMPYHMVFSNKLDNEWTDTLWQLSQKIDSKPAVDALFLSLFYRWFLFEYIFESEVANKEMDKDIQFKRLEAESGYADLSLFDSLLTKERVERLEHILDLFSEHYETILRDSSPSWWGDTPAYFLFDKEITQPQRVVLYGVCTYLDTNTNFDKTKFGQWMRVVWNIVENTDIDSWRSAIGVLKLIQELSDHSQDIYENYPESLKSRSIAADDERRKVTFIRKDPKWEESFIKAEKHPFLKGRIDFMIEDKMTPEEFEHRTEMVYKVFDEKGIGDSYRKEHLLLRAIISQYTSFEQLKNRNFTDTDENEHYLKKMLAGDGVVKKALRSWLSLESEEALKVKLMQVVDESSKMDNRSTPFETKMHEDLYKKPDLQNWMQNKKAIRFALHGSVSYYVSRPRSWYDWVMLDSYRDEMINALVDQHTLVQPNHVEDTKYHWGLSVVLKRNVQLCSLEEVTFVYNFREDGTLRVGIAEEMKENDDCIDKLNSVLFDADDKESGWICRKKYSYKEVTAEDEVASFLGRIEEEVFDPHNTDSLFSCINVH